ncbi:MAG: hypothetical protein NTV67_03915 [Chloroflexi bacterium]|nr:hypothetical protein [Chloroflexota bacterium]
MRKAAALLSSLLLLTAITLSAPQRVRAADLIIYIGPGGGNGECASPSPIYLTDGDADNEQFSAATFVAQGNINNIVYVCPGTYDMDEKVPINGELTLASVDGAKSTILDAAESSESILVLNATVVVIGLTFQNADTTSDGGAIDASFGLTIRDSVFRDNTANEGGAVYSDGDDDTATITGSTFTNNTAHSYGGAVGFYYSIDLIEDCIFLSNEAEDGWGGAVYIYYDVYDIDNDGESGIVNNVFRSNLASGDGGGLLVEGSLKTGSKITRNEFSSNGAGDDGGGLSIATMEAGTTISGNTFSGNQGDLDDDDNGVGGGLRLVEVFGTLSSNRFINNEAGLGGGLFSRDLVGTAVLTRNTFINNTASVDGGGAWVDDWGGEQTELAQFNGNSFRSNHAARNGGGLFLSFDATEVMPKFFTRNTYRGNRAATGGGIAFTGLGNDDTDCAAPLKSIRSVARAFRGDRFASNSATAARRTQNYALLECATPPG